MPRQYRPRASRPTSTVSFCSSVHGTLDGASVRTQLSAMAADIPEDTTNAAPMPMASTTANINCFIDNLPVPQGDPTPTAPIPPQAGCPRLASPNHDARYNDLARWNSTGLCRDPGAKFRCGQIGGGLFYNTARKILFKPSRADGNSVEEPTDD